MTIAGEIDGHQGGPAFVVTAWAHAGEHATMVVRLNNSGFDHARRLVNEGKFVADKRDALSDHQPSAADENEFIRLHGYAEFGRWHLGINDEKSGSTKGHYEFPYGDFLNVHRCAILSAESRAGQYKHYDIENAAAHLHGMIDAGPADTA